MRNIFITAAAVALLSGPAFAEKDVIIEGWDPLTREEAIEKAAERFDRMDANGDGVVTREEMAVKTSVEDTRKKPRMFRADKNGDGFLTPEEVDAGLASEERRNLLVRFTAIDLDEDGRISLKEAHMAAPKPKPAEPRKKALDEAGPETSKEKGAE